MRRRTKTCMIELIDWAAVNIYSTRTLRLVDTPIDYCNADCTLAFFDPMHESSALVFYFRETWRPGHAILARYSRLKIRPV